MLSIWRGGSGNAGGFEVKSKYILYKLTSLPACLSVFNWLYLTTIFHFMISHIGCDFNDCHF